MTSILALFITNAILTDITTFINLKLVTSEEVLTLQTFQTKNIMELSRGSMDLVNALDVKPWLVYAPIASDWELYNKADNHGELLGFKNSKL